MREQQVYIQLKDDNGVQLGILKISAIDYFGNEDDSEFISINDDIKLRNVDIVNSTDNISPIQYCSNYSDYFANLTFLEETDYQILFESDNFEDNIDVLYYITTINPSFFKSFRFPLSDEKLVRLAGNLNFRSYVGKSFLDVKKEDIKSQPIAIEVRSKKIDYFNQYPQMIADLSKYSSNLFFDMDSALFQEFDLDNRQKTIYYEDFMFLEYLFREENLPTTFEYLVRNLYSRLENYKNVVPFSLASNISEVELVDMVSKPGNFYKTENFSLLPNFNGFAPLEIEESVHMDTIDIAENRFLKYFLENIYELIEKMLASSKEGYIKDKLLFFNDLILTYLTNNIFRDISSLDFIPYNSQVLQKKEGYRDIFNYYLMFEFAFKLNWKDLSDNFKGFEKKLSELYEYWCYFKLLDVLDQMSSNSINLEDVFRINKNNWEISLKKGQLSLNHFDINYKGKSIEIDLFYNLLFTERSKHKSYSLAFKPDYTLLIKIDENSYFIHFDAKYRSEIEIVDFYDKIRNKSDVEIEKQVDKYNADEELKYSFKYGDIYKMHTYKDSILKTEGAYILYPGDESKIFKENDLIIPSVGALSLNPGNKVDEDNLAIFIRKLIESLI